MFVLCRFSIIQTALDKSNTLPEVVHEIPSLIPGNSNFEREEKVDRTSEILQEKQLQKALKVSHIVGTIKEIIDTRYPCFRYATNKQCASLIREKLQDSTGSNSIKEVSKFCLNLDLDETE